MNITNINAKGSNSVSGFNLGNAGKSDIFKQGRIVEGIISKISDKISINFNGQEIKFPKSAVQNAREGEIRRFEIKDVSEGSIVLKEVGSEARSSGAVRINRTSVKTNQSVFNAHLEKTQEEKAEEKAKRQANMQTQAQLNNASGRLTGEDYQEMEEGGETLESFEASRLERALDRVKEQREFRRTSEEKEIAKNKEFQSQMEEMATVPGMQGPHADAIVKKLQDSDIPVTKENIEKIASAIELASMAGNITEKGMEHMIDNELAPTIENLYKAEYSGSANNPQYINDEAWEELKGQVETILADAGLEVNEDNIQNAKWLLDRGLAVTKDNFLSLENLKEIKRLADEGKLLDYAADKAIDALRGGRNPEGAYLEAVLETQVRDQISALPSISDEAIYAVVEQQKEVTIANLLSAEAERGHSGSGQGKQTADWSGKESLDIAAVTARRQLEEVRLKMTAEAGMRLRNKGISLDTTELSKLIDELKTIEDEYYAGLLKEADAADSSENVAMLRGTVEGLASLRMMPSYILGAPERLSHLDTIYSLNEKGDVLKLQLDKANQSYDTLMTAPSREYGDSIQKAFRSVDPLLEDMGLEQTEANRRAVRILGYNGLDITEESILHMKNYDAEVNSVMKNLHPSVAVRLIKEGINPVDIPMDELNQMVLDMKEEMGISDEEKYSKFLWKLEKQDNISEDERKSYIGIYRLLNNIEKSDGAALGAVLNAGKEVTLANLLTAVRTIKSGGIDQEVDEEAGMLQSLTFQSQSITDQINTAYTQETAENNPKNQYMNQVLSEIMNEVSPEKLNSIDQEDDILNMSAEMLKEKLQSDEGDPSIDLAYYSEKAESIRELAKNSETAVDMLNYYNLPVTFEEVQSAGMIVNGETNIYKELQKNLDLDWNNQSELSEIINNFDDAMDDYESLNQKFNDLGAAVSNAVTGEYSNSTITAGRLAELRNLNNSIQLTKKLSRQEHYEIPVVTGDQITNIKLTIIHGAKDKGKVHMNVDSENLGNIEAEFTIKNGSAAGYILCSNKETADMLGAVQEELDTRFTEAGIEPEGIRYGVDHLMNRIHYASKSENEGAEATVDIGKLYQSAKIFVQHIKELERI